jgi:hypothetical protein
MHAATYNVFWDTTPGVTATSGTKIASSSSSIKHTGLTNGQRYYYVITAENASGESPLSGEKSIVPGALIWSTPEAQAANVTLGAGSTGLDPFSIALDGKGGAIIGWIEPDGGGVDHAFIQEFSTDVGWQSKVQVDSGASERAAWIKVGSNSRGDRAATWTKLGSGVWNIWVDIYSSSTEQWLGPMMLESDALGARKNVSVSDDGTVSVVWLKSESRSFTGGPVLDVDTLYANIYSPTNGWSGKFLVDSPTGIGESSYPRVASDKSGVAIFVWRRTHCDDAQSTTTCQGNEEILVREYTPGLGLNAVQTLSSSNDVINPRLSVNASGYGAATWSSGSPGDVVGRIRNAQTGWSSTSQILDSRTDTAFFPHASVNPDGNGLVTWQQNSQTWSSTFNPVQGWGSATLADRKLSPQSNVAVAGDGVAFILGTGSRSADVTALKYSESAGWGEKTTLREGTNDAQEAMIASDKYGNFFALWAQDGQLFTSRFGSPIVIQTNVPPNAHAGSDQTVVEGSLVSLDGTMSTDTDGTIASYSWQQTVGPAASLDDPSSATPSFTAPAVSEDTVLTFELTVLDDQNATDTDSVDILVQVDLPNAPPIANAGIDQTVIEQSTVTLDASASSDSDGSIVSYSWTQTAGPGVTLDDPSSIAPSFIAPVVSVDTTISFQLTVTDNEGAFDSDLVDIVIQPAPPNSPPTADAGQDQSVAEGALVALDGTASSDSDGSISTYSWTQVSGPAVNLSDSSSSAPTFVAPQVASDTTLTFELTVTDDDGATGQDLVDVLVQDSGADVTPPVTTITSVKDKVKGTTFYDITLSSNEPGSTMFRISGDGQIVSGGTNTPEFQLYGGPVRVEITNRNGAATLDVYSVDTAGNIETTQTQSLPW